LEKIHFNSISHVTNFIKNAHVAYTLQLTEKKVDSKNKNMKFPHAVCDV